LITFPPASLKVKVRQPLARITTLSPLSVYTHTYPQLTSALYNPKKSPIPIAITPITPARTCVAAPVKATGGPDVVTVALTLTDEEGATVMAEEVEDVAVVAGTAAAVAGTAAMELEALVALGMGRVTPAEAQSWAANASVSVGLLVWM
jgi:hypothetical protein